MDFQKAHCKLTSVYELVQAYMVELYQDTLVDLLLPKQAKRLKLDIKKDAKVIVIWSFLNYQYLICQ